MAKQLKRRVFAGENKDGDAKQQLRKKKSPQKPGNKAQSNKAKMSALDTSAVGGGELDEMVEEISGEITPGRANMLLQVRTMLLLLLLLRLLLWLLLRLHTCCSY